MIRINLRLIRMNRFKADMRSSNGLVGGYHKIILVLFLVRKSGRSLGILYSKESDSLLFSLARMAYYSGYMFLLRGILRILLFLILVFF